jgi:hypothetical protein
VPLAAGELYDILAEEILKEIDAQIIESFKPIKIGMWLR